MLIRNRGLLATLSLLASSGTNGQNTSTAGPPWVESDYATSPPVYPSPNATGSGWEAAFEQASNFVSQLTLEEKVRLVTGTAGPCVGNIGPVHRLGFNGLCLQDGPLAIREADYASVFPAGLTTAASWDRRLAHVRGQDMADEFVGKGAHVALGPVAGPLGRSGLGGRNWEGFSPDPWLTGELFAETIIGMEEHGIQACAKHYIGNEQETQRNPSVNDDGQTIEAVSSNIDDRTMHEVYAWPFANAVKAGASSIMWTSSASKATVRLLVLISLSNDTDGAQVVSDWGATHAGVATILAGLDMDMPGGIGFTETAHSFFGGNLTAAVNNGSVPIERVDDMVRRVMTPYFRLNQNAASYPGTDPSSDGLNFFQPDQYQYNWTYNSQRDVDVRGDHAKLIRELGAAGIVLLKNTNNALPLKAPKNIGVFGNDAGDLVDGQYSLSNLNLGDGNFEFGILANGGGSGAGRLTYVIPPLDAIKQRARQDGSLVQYVLNNSVPTQSGNLQPMYPPPEVCLVFLKTWATEGFDRESLLVDWNGTALATTVADNCANTIVVTHSGGLNVLPFADHPNITAILAAHYGGQEAGNSIVDVLYGDVNPSGHLPYTIAKEEDDYDFAPITNSSELLNTTNPDAWQSDFRERLLIDYRHFDFYNISVQYEFGFGLSYTTFDMSNISISNPSSPSIASLCPSSSSTHSTSGTQPPGGNSALWETLYTVSASVTNTGSVMGAAVPQLYLGLPQPANEDVTPTKVLRGFEKVALQPGESQKVDFPLMRRDLSYWDIDQQQWVIGDGAVKVYAGFSSRDIKAETSFNPLGDNGQAEKRWAFERRWSGKKA